MIFYLITVMGPPFRVLGVNSSGCSDCVGTTVGKPPYFHLPNLSCLLCLSVTLPKHVHQDLFSPPTEFHFPCLPS